ncbi:hypothetical protein E2C01_004783 [Portunus trituberculatus]|uniref:Uncharacterized protein n=1 Tax=Portunus trituberculatus TaxID=210409 RepID=A0A5B7CS95_PORTR|nr:hypothetical protein [Portunus trituberculatus]
MEKGHSRGNTSDQQLNSTQPLKRQQQDNTSMTSATKDQQTTRVYAKVERSIRPILRGLPSASSQSPPQRVIASKSLVVAEQSREERRERTQPNNQNHSLGTEETRFKNDDDDGDNDGDDNSTDSSNTNSGDEDKIKEEEEEED